MLTNTIRIFREFFPPECCKNVFITGGAIRDDMLGEDREDVDIITFLSKDQITQLGFRKILGKSTDPIYVQKIPAIGVVEATIPAEGVTLNEELQRRDFTVNAIAINLSGEFIDPLEGLIDLKNRSLKACTKNTFINDPARIFRMFRFEANGWTATEETKYLVDSINWKIALNDIPVERFTREMLKAMEGMNPSLFFKRMVETGIGGCYFPEIFQMQKVPAGPEKYHPEGDLFSHSCEVLDRAVSLTNNAIARLAAFLHDIGKLGTDPGNYPHHFGHDEAGFQIAGETCDRLRLSSLIRKSVKCTCRLHQSLNEWSKMRTSSKLKKVMHALKAGIEGWLPDVIEADHGTLDIKEWETAVKVCKKTTKMLGINPKRFESIKPNDINSILMQYRIECFEKCMKVCKSL
ncbi:MAG: HD domain-containing protein [Nitrospinota bacterium]|nr:HD domain-containing protein [Nitrospinota bacterium]